MKTVFGVGAVFMELMGICGGRSIVHWMIGGVKKVNIVLNKGTFLALARIQTSLGSLEVCTKSAALIISSNIIDTYFVLLVSAFSLTILGISDGKVILVSACLVLRFFIMHPLLGLIGGETD